MLCACTATTKASPSAFLADLRPLAGEIPKYSAAMSQPYAPRVTGRGVAAVHEAVMSNPYRTESADTWTPADIWTGGGDCEDFALAAIRELKAQGIGDTYLMVMKHPTRGAHAVAVVREGESLTVLDVQRDTPADLGSVLREWTPAYLIETKTGRVLVEREPS